MTPAAQLRAARALIAPPAAQLRAARALIAPPAAQLRAARALIAPPAAWCQNALARCQLGRPVSSRSAEAACWCGVGALRTVNRGSLSDSVLDALGAAAGGTYALWQDRPGRTQAEVLAVFDRAIASDNDLRKGS